MDMGSGVVGKIEDLVGMAVGCVEGFDNIVARCMVW